ncbi:hypothetical protein KQX54_017541 [Cotesia glomerata]|uniref:Cytochrome P450 n=1 Tax=Cotesia glomerata TaxID=32391 RepID=A0AAV7ICW1_COTGL|nr:hypothetical protein KQX54_017541 [Cotesia glomerata]
MTSHFSRREFNKITTVVSVLLVIYYYYYTNNWNFWSSRKVVGPKPSIPFGTVSDIITGRHNIGTYLQKIYTTYRKSKLVGIYMLRKPVVILNDLDLVKDVLIKDFSKFVDRGGEIHENHEPLAVHLFNLEPQKWRPLRSKLFATDVISVCPFGLQAYALAEEDSLFWKMGKKIFELNIRNVGRAILGDFMPELYKVVGYFFMDSVLDNFIIGITKDTMDYRRKNGINRKDFVDLLIALKDEPSKVGDIELTDKLLAAQLFVFFAAGFETSSTTIGNALYEMALNHSVQEKLRQEIKDELIRTDGKFTYEGVKNMKYTERKLYEKLR